MANGGARFKAYSKKKAIEFVRRGSVQAGNELKVILGPKGGTRTGRITPRGKNSHQASAAGEIPAVDTGALRQSATHETIKVEGSKVTGGASVSAPYAIHLQLGTEKMKARPFIDELSKEPYKSKIEAAAKGAFK